MTAYQYHALPLTPGAPRVFEVKRHPDGPPHRFECELVHRTPALVVAWFPLESSYGALDSYGIFWARRPYNVYHLVPRDPVAPVRSRFDVLRDVRFEPVGADIEVSYLDLYLDLWVTDGVPRWEDEADVDAARDAGLLTPADLAHIHRARSVLERRHSRVIAEVRALLATLGLRA